MGKLEKRVGNRKLLGINYYKLYMKLSSKIEAMMDTIVREKSQQSWLFWKKNIAR